jgi:hypothetical protein
MSEHLEYRHFDVLQPGPDPDAGMLGSFIIGIPAMTFREFQNNSYPRYLQLQQVSGCLSAISPNTCCAVRSKMNELLSTVFWSAITLAVFFGWRRIFLALKHPLLHPILWATLAVALLLALGRHPVAAYREESAPLVWLLGPAVVAMAVPIWQRRELIVSNWKALLLVVALGIAFSAFSVLLLGPFLGWREAKSLVPKSVQRQ